MRKLLAMLVVGAVVGSAADASAQKPKKPDPQPMHGADSLQRARHNAEEAAKIKVKDKDNLVGQATITPTRAAEIALAKVPGQLASNELKREDGRLVYDLKVLPDRKKTYTGIQVDGMTGDVLGMKQFGGVRGAAGYVRENADRKAHKVKPDDKKPYRR